MLDKYNEFDNKKKRMLTLLTRFDICEKDVTINDDGSIDVDGNVNFSFSGLTKIPVNFGEVTGNFYCDNNLLTNLKGAPKKVGGNFYCSHNELTTLEGCTEEVGGNFYCDNNKLTSLKYGPEKAGGYFCAYNKITSLEYLPEKLEGNNLDFRNNKVTSFEHMPYLGYGVYCAGNPISTVTNVFTFNKDVNNLIELFNYYDIVQGDKVIYDRLIYFYEELNINISKKLIASMIRDIEKYYTIVR